MMNIHYTHCGNHFMMCVKSNSYTVQCKLTQCMQACSVAKSCLTLCDPIDCSPPGSSGPEFFQA